MFDIETLLPHTAGDLQRDLEIVTAERIEGIENPLRDLWNVDTCPVHLLPWLAWAFSVEVWDHEWPEAIKRNVIRNATHVHRSKGTRRAVELALAALNMRIDLHEGFELDEHRDRYGPAHTFTLDTFADDIFDAGFQINARLHAIVTELIANVKPVHVCEASDANADLFPVGTTTLIAGNQDDKRVAGLGAGSDAPQFIDGIFDQVNAKVFLHRLSEGADEADTISNTIGGIDSDTGRRHGLGASFDVKQRFGIDPSIFIAPGVSQHQAVATEEASGDQGRYAGGQCANHR